MAVKEYVSVQFGDRPAAGSVLIEVDPTPPHVYGYQYMLRVYSGGDRPTVRATLGEVSVLAYKAKMVEEEGLTFDGTDTASVKYPVGNVSRLRVTGDTFNEKGSRISVSLHWDEDRQQVVASKEFYGVATISYEAPYVLVGYNYEKRKQVVGKYHGRRLYQIMNIPGTVYAFVQSEPPKVGSFQIPEYEFSFSDNPQDRVELYRQVSYAQVTAEGVFERHENHPNQTFVPNDYENYVVENKLTHLVGYMDRFGRRYELTYTIVPKKPFSGFSDASAAGYPVKTWEFVTFDNPDQAFSDENLYRQAITYVSEKRAEVGA